MTGPPYPRTDPNASSAIGSFVIGVSPIGGFGSFDYWATVINQYANSPTLTRIVGDVSQNLDQRANIDSFFSLIWDVSTAVGYGLDVWGRIVGVGRVLRIPRGKWFGFNEAAIRSFAVGTFDESPFFNGETPTLDNYSLTDAEFRPLIYAKARANISNGSIPSINQILLALFPGRGNCYVTDGQDMTMTYTFDFLLTAIEAAIVIETNILPRPTGVRLSIVQN